jgi:hypothetical protein
MNKQDLSNYLKTSINIDLPDFILNLIVVGLLCYLIKIVYIKFSTTLSNREEFSKNFILLGIATCIVITIVKNSLALSLGLVGALSIVRFRAAIKEPEELVYLFLVIAVGLGGGAGQIKITVAGMIIGFITIYLSSFKSAKSQKSDDVINLGIIIEKQIGENEINQILDDAKEISRELKFISMSKTNTDVSINLDVKPIKFELLNKLSESINKKFPNSKVIISQNNDLAI